MRPWLLIAMMFAGVASAEEPRFGVVAISPDRAHFKKMLKDEARRARRDGLQPYVELWAPWCEACVILKRGLDDPRIQRAMDGTYIIMVNVDDTGEFLASAGFGANSIPTFYELRDDGRPTGRKSDDKGWEADRAEVIAAFLDRFFHPRVTSSRRD